MGGVIREQELDRSLKDYRIVSSKYFKELLVIENTAIFGVKFWDDPINTNVTL